MRVCCIRALGRFLPVLTVLRGCLCVHRMLESGDGGDASGLSGFCALFASTLVFWSLERWRQGTGRPRVGIDRLLVRGVANRSHIRLVVTGMRAGGVGLDGRRRGRAVTPGAGVVSILRVPIGVITSAQCDGSWRATRG